MEQLRWGVIGTGGIAADFCEALKRSQRCRVVNIAGSSPSKARAFAERFGLAGWSDGVPHLLADRAVDAVYIATPHPLHEPHALSCIEAGKHVLCEKPLTVDEPGAARVLAAAKRRGIFVMEAFMYRCHPLLRELLSRLQDGAIGAIRHVRADFGFRVARMPEHRLFNVSLGGGSILDVGGYPVSFARLIAGVVEGTPFAEPTGLTATGLIGPTGTDELATAQLEFRSGLTASVTSAIYYDVGTTAVVFGEHGKIVLPDPWIPGSRRQGLVTELTVFRDGHNPEHVTVRTDLATYAIQAELVRDTLPAIEAAWPAMSHADTLGNMRVLDSWQALIHRGRNGYTSSTMPLALT
ncbi:MAG TPA: Gfo/Idh/MocA family oxidoreductase [Vicinamibacterales bacterium]|nr:Gfo/Idh/MocA family oxidoreductase [Vicinamibacterales bacterium]